MIRRGITPGTTEYFEKSVTPQRFLRKSSSRSKTPFTDSAGALIIARIASEKIVFDVYSISRGCLDVRYIAYWFSQVFFS